MKLSEKIINRVVKKIQLESRETEILETKKFICFLKQSNNPKIQKFLIKYHIDEIEQSIDKDEIDNNSLKYLKLLRKNFGFMC